MVAEIEYSAWTQDGKLRQPSFKAVRALDDKAKVFALDT
ncbi:ATP dependent DNA ligase [Ensifer adhaerens]